MKLFNQNHIKLFNTFLFDCDGVIWRRNGIIPGVSNAISKLCNENKKIFFVVL